MTLNDLIPGLRGTGSRRAVDKVAELRDENRRLLTITHRAGDDIALLQQKLADTAAKQGQAEELVVQLQADKDDVIEECDRLRAEVLRFRARFGAQIAAEANAHRITVPPMVRDTTDPADQATGPIDVRPLWAARDAGLLGPVASPGHTH
ncbi:hypothetical protein GCM10010099_22540 [Streptomyces cinereus]|nr:hypothetical protein GCM10010099_22540 [Streptomyces cinereus]